MERLRHFCAGVKPPPLSFEACANLTLHLLHVRSDQPGRVGSWNGPHAHSRAKSVAVAREVHLSEHHLADLVVAEPLDRARSSCRCIYPPVVSTHLLPRTIEGRIRLQLSGDVLERCISSTQLYSSQHETAVRPQRRGGVPKVLSFAELEGPTSFVTAHMTETIDVTPDDAVVAGDTIAKEEVPQVEVGDKVGIRLDQPADQSTANDDRGSAGHEAQSLAVLGMPCVLLHCFQDDVSIRPEPNRGILERVSTVLHCSHNNFGIRTQLCGDIFEIPWVVLHYFQDGRTPQFRGGGI
eukprot:scaffold10678_cov70-Phaeocystis_antarctica.AAC.2